MPPSQRHKEQFPGRECYFEHVNILHFGKSEVIQVIQIKRAKPISITGDAAQVDWGDKLDLFAPVNLRHQNRRGIMVQARDGALGSKPYSHVSLYVEGIEMAI